MVGKRGRRMSNWRGKVEQVMVEKAKFNLKVDDDSKWVFETRRRVDE